MPVMDDIKKETSKMKDKSLREKLAYFWGYYKLHCLAVLAALFLVSWLVHDLVTQKEHAFYAVLVNAGGYNISDTAADAFADYADIDQSQYDVTIDSSIVYDPSDFSQDSYYGSMKLSAILAAGEVDTFVSTETTFTNYALSESFFRLEEVLSEEQLAALEGKLYYIDQADIDAAASAETDLSADAVEAEMALSAYSSDHHDPSQMENPLAVGIYLDVEDIPFFMENNCYLSGEVIYGFMCNAKHTEYAVRFLSYLTGI